MFIYFLNFYLCIYPLFLLYFSFFCYYHVYFLVIFVLSCLFCVNVNKNSKLDRPAPFTLVSVFRYFDVYFYLVLYHPLLYLPPSFLNKNLNLNLGWRDLLPSFRRVKTSSPGLPASSRLSGPRRAPRTAHRRRHPPPGPAPIKGAPQPAARHSRTSSGKKRTSLTPPLRSSSPGSSRTQPRTAHRRRHPPAGTRTNTHAQKHTHTDTHTQKKNASWGQHLGGDSDDHPGNN